MTTGALHIRHVPQLLELGETIFANGLRILGVQFDQEAWLADIWRLLKMNDRKAFVCESDSTVCGVLALMIAPAFFAQSTPRAYVLTLWLNPQVRQNGMARMLMAHAEQWARARGCRCIIAGVPDDYRGQHDIGDENASAEQAQAFYERCGFKPLELMLTKELI